MKHLKPHSRFVFLVLCLLGSFSTVNAAEVTTQKNNLNISFGGFNISSKTGTVSAIGLFQLQYRRQVTPRWSLEGAFANGTSVTSGASSLFWGVDLGGSYAFGVGFPRVQQISDVMTIDEHERFGFFGSLGFSIRSIPLSNSTLTYSGFYVAVQPQYFITDIIECHARAQLGMLTNSTNSLTFMSLALGVGIVF